MSYIAFNGASPTTAAMVRVTTGTTIKTMQQIATPSTRQIKIIEWGYSIDISPTTTGIGIVELLQTDVAATVTAYTTATGIVNLDPNGTTSLCVGGTTASGFTASGEGTVAATRSFDVQCIQGQTNGASQTNYNRTFLPGYQPIVAVSKFLRVRVTFSVASPMICR